MELAADRLDREVIVGIGGAVAGGAIADFEINDILLRLVDEMVGVAGLIPRTCPASSACGPRL